VGVLFDALRKEKRWNNSIVLVTADHGEAFYEHGVQAHTTTLYDEMIHVPFMLRLPRRRDTSHVDTGRLVVLSDVVPTISVSSGSSLAMRLAESTFYAKASSPHRG
ncbi:MAG TPA: sulfatase-like hydrolase/transferase, partial [Acidobacteriota bacterium]|nr:sulfatase-like hydrolase/transferase [Acidobacteriota bacterium]